MGASDIAQQQAIGVQADRVGRVPGQRLLKQLHRTALAGQCPWRSPPGRRSGWRCVGTKGSRLLHIACCFLELFAATEHLGDVQAHEQAFVAFGAVGALLPALQSEIVLAQRMVGIAQFKQQIGQRVVTSSRCGAVPDPPLASAAATPVGAHPGGRD